MLIIIGGGEITRLLVRMESTMVTKQQLDDAIAGLPGTLAIALTPAISTAVETAIKPVIDALKEKGAGTPIDFQSELDALNNLGANVAAAVAPAVATAVADSLNPPATSDPIGSGESGSETP